MRPWHGVDLVYNLAFDRRFRGCIHLRASVDAFAVCHNLTRQGHVASMLNRANVCLLGNHFFDSSADNTIYEKIHRRREKLSTVLRLLSRAHRLLRGPVNGLA